MGNFFNKIGHKLKTVFSGRTSNVNQAQNTRRAQNNTQINPGIFQQRSNAQMQKAAQAYTDIGNSTTLHNAEQLMKRLKPQVDNYSKQVSQQYNQARTQYDYQVGIMDANQQVFDNFFDNGVSEQEVNGVMNEFSVFPNIRDTYNSASNQYSSQYFQGYNNTLKQHMDYQYQANQRQLSYADRLAQKAERQIASQQPAVQQRYNQAWNQFDNAVAQFQGNQNMIIGMMSSFGPQVDSDEVNALLAKAQGAVVGSGIQTSSFLAASSDKGVSGKFTSSDISVLDGLPTLSATMRFPDYKDPDTDSLSKEWVNKIANTYHIDPTAVSLYANKDIAEGKNPVSRYDDPQQLQEVNKGVIKFSGEDAYKRDPRLNDGELPFIPAYLPDSDNVIDPIWAKDVSQRFSLSLGEVVTKAKLDSLYDKDPNYRYFSPQQKSEYDKQKLEYDAKKSGIDSAWIYNISKKYHISAEEVLLNARFDKLDGLDLNFRYNDPRGFKQFQAAQRILMDMPSVPNNDI